MTQIVLVLTQIVLLCCIGSAHVSCHIIGGTFDVFGGIGSAYGSYGITGGIFDVFGGVGAGYCS